ncbi:MAG: M1 family metallopeptidase [Cellulophaga sp.]
MKRNILFSLLYLLGSSHAYSQIKTLNYGAIDIQKYEFHIAVNDSSDEIKGEAIITLKTTASLSSFILDLENKDLFNKGMVIETVNRNDKALRFEHANNKVVIFTEITTSNTEITFSIKYHGIPKDGLVISKNKYGDRTFFGDNWPNRAHQWLPTVDHPSDKALVEWHVTAPSHYQVIGNGTQQEETDLSDKNTLYVWKSEVPIPTKVMVIGIARFAVQHIGETHNIPISSWVYPQNKKEGFYDYALAKDVINFFIENVGPYPYSKLANVQSKTRFGGMENASNIFYFENSVSGERKIENLIAHEIAHQWFGNSATESGWEHIWLSEGFATYFTNLYVLETKGKDALDNLLIKQRNKVIEFYKKQYTPVIDKTSTDLMKLLNANSYQKGGWILHMLRKKLGDAVFWKGIRTYYKKFALKNASTNDLKQVFEEVSGKKLGVFFTQWLEKAGHPSLKTTWKQSRNKVKYKILQIQKSDNIFTFPIELKIAYEDGTTEITSVSVLDKKSSFLLAVKSKVKEISMDPNCWLLFEKVD